MRRTAGVVIGLLVGALVTGCDDEAPAQPEGPPPHLIRQLQEGRSIRAVDTCDAVRAIPSIEERASEVVGQEVSYYEDYYGESEHSLSASCDLAVAERSDERLVFTLHEESDIAVGYESWDIEIVDGCFVEPDTATGVACRSDLTMGMSVVGGDGHVSTCGENVDDACQLLMRDFLIAIDAQDPDENLDPDDEGRPEVIAQLAGGENLMYRHDVCKAIAYAGLEDDLDRLLDVDDSVLYSGIYGHPRDELVIDCTMYADVDPAEEGKELVLTLALAFSRAPVSALGDGEEVFPGCGLDELQVVCGDHVTLRLDGDTEAVEDYPALAHDVLVALSKQG